MEISHEKRFDITSNFVLKINYKAFLWEKWEKARRESSSDIDIVVGIARGQIDQFISENERGSDTVTLL